jgi:hypothetical protein
MSARLDALEREIGTSPKAFEPEPAPATPAYGGPLDSASPVSMILFLIPLPPSVQNSN